MEGTLAAARARAVAGAEAAAMGAPADALAGGATMLAWSTTGGAAHLLVITHAPLRLDLCVLRARAFANA